MNGYILIFDQRKEEEERKKERTENRVENKEEKKRTEGQKDDAKTLMDTAFIVGIYLEKCFKKSGFSCPSLMHTNSALRPDCVQ